MQWVTLTPPVWVGLRNFRKSSICGQVTARHVWGWLIFYKKVCIVQWQHNECSLFYWNKNLQRDIGFCVLEVFSFIVPRAWRAWHCACFFPHYSLFRFRSHGHIKLEYTSTKNLDLVRSGSTEFSMRYALQCIYIHRLECHLFFVRVIYLKNIKILISRITTQLSQHTDRKNRTYSTTWKFQLSGRWKMEDGRHFIYCPRM